MTFPASHEGTHSARRRPSVAGFTLTELLVVLAVIAVIAALLIPTISSARAKGQGSRCAGNLRQLGVLVTLYASERNGSLPQATMHAVGTGSWTWHSYYYGVHDPNSPLAGHPMGGPLVYMAGIYKDGGMTSAEYFKNGATHIFNCPSNSKSPVQPFASRGYVPNQFLMTWKWEPPQRVSRVENPAQVILIADNNSDGAAPEIHLHNFNEWNWRVRIGFHRHSGKANALFLDGSVRAVSQGDIDPKRHIRPPGL